MWSKLHTIAEKCGSNFVRDLLNTQYLHNWVVINFCIQMITSLVQDETKGIMLPYDSHASISVVTLGVGKDIRAEERLRQLIPNATFYGADPILESGIVYKSIGQYLQVNTIRRS